MIEVEIPELDSVIEFPDETPEDEINGQIQTILAEQGKAPQQEEPGVVDLAGRGLAHGTIGILESIGTGLEYLGHRLPEGEFSKKLSAFGKERSQTYGEVAEQYAPPEDISGKNVIDNPELLADLDWWTYNVADMIPSFAAAMLPGGAAYKVMKGAGVALNLPVVARLAKLGAGLVGGAAGGALEATQTYKSVLAEGGSEKEAASAAEFMWAASGALNAISVSNILGKVGAGFLAGAKKRGINALVEGVTEGLEEPSEVGGKLLSKYLHGVEMPKEVGDLFVESFKEAATVAPIAAVTGGALGGGGQRATKKAPAEKPTELTDDQKAEQIVSQIDKDVKAGNVTIDDLIAQRKELGEEDAVLASAVDQVIEKNAKEGETAYWDKQKAEIERQQKEAKTEPYKQKPTERKPPEGGRGEKKRDVAAREKNQREIDARSLLEKSPETVKAVSKIEPEGARADAELGRIEREIDRKAKKDRRAQIPKIIKAQGEIEPVIDRFAQRIETHLPNGYTVSNEIKTDLHGLDDVKGALDLINPILKATKDRKKRIDTAVRTAKQNPQLQPLINNVMKGFGNDQAYKRRLSRSEREGAQPGDVQGEKRPEEGEKAVETGGILQGEEQKPTEVVRDEKTPEVIESQHFKKGKLPEKWTRIAGSDSIKSPYGNYIISGEPGQYRLSNEDTGQVIGGTYTNHFAAAKIANEDFIITTRGSVSTKVEKPIDKLRNDLEQKGSGRIGKADFKIAQVRGGSFYYTKTEKGIRYESGPGYPATWSRETAINKAMKEAEKYAEYEQIRNEAVEQVGEDIVEAVEIQADAAEPPKKKPKVKKKKPRYKNVVAEPVGGVAMTPDQYVGHIKNKKESGIKYTEEAEVEETGQIVKIEKDAAVMLREIDTKIESYNTLLDCLG